MAADGWHYRWAVAVGRIGRILMRRYSLDAGPRHDLARDRRARLAADRLTSVATADSASATPLHSGHPNAASWVPLKANQQAHVVITEN